MPSSPTTTPRSTPTREVRCKYLAASQDATAAPPLVSLDTRRRIPDRPACFSWAEGNASVLQEGFDLATSSPGSVLVSRSGDLSPTSAYGFTYDIDFSGEAVRGDMDLRLLVSGASANEEFVGGFEEMFSGLGSSSSVEAALSANLDSVNFTDAVVELT